MTDELFRNDASLRCCEARVVAVDEQGIELDRTVFYPQGGGQAGDAGTLQLADGRRILITDTRKRRDDPARIVHMPSADTPIPQPGDGVLAVIDPVRRMAHMRLHTATHLLCALVPHPVDGCSITQSYARLDFHMKEPLEKDALSAGLARLVAAARAVRLRWVTDADLDANPQWVRSMSVQPPRGSGRIRMVEIEDVDLQPCGGTHVTNTAEVGAVLVIKIEKKSASTRRVVLGFAGQSPAPV